MSTTEKAEERRFPGGLTPPGRASFEWAVLFATLALAFPESGLVGLFFAARSRRLGYARWGAVMAISIWCLVLGVGIRLFIHLPVFP
jgi:hypothetical protein